MTDVMDSAAVAVEPRKRKIMSFDQATVKSGFAVFEGDALVQYGLIDLGSRFYKDMTTDERTRLMGVKLCDMIKETQPDVVVLEDVFLTRNIKAVIVQAELIGIVMGYCDLNNLPIVILKPSQWRKVCGLKQGRIKRLELKEEAIDFVKSSFNIDCKTDEADAICIGFSVFYEELLRQQEAQKQAQQPKAEQLVMEQAAEPQKKRGRRTKRQVTEANTAEVNTDANI